MLSLFAQTRKLCAVPLAAMGHDRRPTSLLITGVYGTGKSSLAAQLAECLEQRRVAYAALDLDWLTWYWVGDNRVDPQHILLRNLASVVGNYVDAGVRHFVAAGTVRHQREMEALRTVLPGPLRVVRLTVPIDVIVERLRHDVGTGRLDDLDVARRDLVAGVGVGVADWTLANDGPITDLAVRVLSLLGWVGEPHSSP
jgi:adenylylsulfate kinase